MSTYPLDDDVVGPIIHQLALVAAQVEGVGEVFEVPPDGPPPDNSVLLPLRKWKVEDHTAGKMKVTLTFEVLHLFTRTQLKQAIQRSQKALHPWWQALTAWPNSTLGGLAYYTDVSDGELHEFTWANTPYLAISHMVDVCTVLNIPTE